MFRAGLPVYVYVWATRLYDFCLIAAADAANKQAPLVTHIERGRVVVGRGEGVKRLWRSSGKLNLSLEHAKRTQNRPLASAMASVFIFIPFANSMEICCRQISFETHVINLFVQHFATLNQLPQPSCHLPLATCFATFSTHSLLALARILVYSAN